MPWDYRKIILLGDRDYLLDMDTGRGEFLLSLGHPYSRTSAAEATLSMWSSPKSLNKEETGTPHGLQWRMKPVFHCNMNHKGLRFTKTCINDFIHSCEAMAAYTLKRNSTTSPSLMTYSLPSERTRPFSLAAFMLPQAIRSS